jgi:formylglycine-generating enzyme required for sulfatase activity
LGILWSGVLTCSSTCTFDISKCQVINGCAGLEKKCGPNKDEDCCTQDGVPGGSFLMGRSTGGPDAFELGSSDELPEHEVSVTKYTMDRYEVTVGRFRKFVLAYDVFIASLQEGDGAHLYIPGSGWKSAWKAKIPPNATALKQKLSGFSSTWTDTPGSFEEKPIVGVSWYEAFLFCAWDNMRLPTEAEWEYAAVGGAENRLYPWGSAAPDSTRAIMDDTGGGCNYQEGGNCALAAVGSRPAGKGRYNHMDLAGNAVEWVLDDYDIGWYGKHTVPLSCKDCANLTDTVFRVQRGGNYGSGPDGVRGAARLGINPDDYSDTHGFRCARN